jgi:hypothetical protein
MEMMAQIEKQLPDVIGKNIFFEEKSVGKVTKYDQKTGLATMEIDDALYHEINLKIINNQYFEISSRAIKK